MYFEPAGQGKAQSTITITQFIRRDAGDTRLNRYSARLGVTYSPMAGIAVPGGIRRVSAFCVVLDAEHRGTVARERADTFSEPSGGSWFGSNGETSLGYRVTWFETATA